MKPTENKLQYRKYGETAKIDAKLYNESQAFICCCISVFIIYNRSPEK